jgi:preprotein translocase subunit YajC
MKTNQPKTRLQKIVQKTAYALGYAISPALSKAIKYHGSESRKNYYNKSENSDTLIFVPLEYPIFLLATAMTIGTTIGINAGYNALVKKEYSAKNITIEIKPDATIKTSFKDLVYYSSPLTKLVQVGLANKITNIKTYRLEIEVENSKIITFDKNSGFTLNKEACYNEDFRIKEGSEWVEYYPSKIKKINNEYERLKQKSLRIRDKAIESGNVGKISRLEDNITQLKKTQDKLEKEISDVVSQLNIEYFSYKNAPKDTAIPGRDYDLSNITK